MKKIWTNIKRLFQSKDIYSIDTKINTIDEKLFETYKDVSWFCHFLRNETSIIGIVDIYTHNKQVKIVYDSKTTSSEKLLRELSEYGLHLEIMSNKPLFKISIK